MCYNNLYKDYRNYITILRGGGVVPRPEFHKLGKTQVQILMKHCGVVE
jgi:hypothetical protein